MADIQTQEEWEIEMSQKILAFVRNEIYLDLRFLDVALSALMPKQDRQLHTFATDGTFLYFSTEQVLRVFRQNALFLDRAYLHSILHCIFGHLWLGGRRERRLWNLSCDIAVEYTIDRMQVPCTKRILNWLRQQMYEELRGQNKSISAAVIYRMVMDYPEEKIRQLEPEFFTDDHCYWPKQEDSEAKRQAAAASQKKWNKIARQTKMEQEQRGDEPKDGEELFAAQLAAEKSRRSYREFLRKFAVLREEMQVDPDEFDLNYYTYGLQLYQNMPLIEPLESRETKKIQEFVIVLDTSYSTSGELVKGFLRETVDILNQNNNFFVDAKIRLLQCDNKVCSDVVIQGKQGLDKLLERFELLGGGGTDFRPAFVYMNELLEQGAFKNLCGLLYFTDGKGIYPKQRPEYKTAFLFLEDYDEEAVPPWAIRLRLSEEEFL